jgi:endonuclease G, mitochondrial
MSLATTEAVRNYLGKVTTDLEELVTGTTELESMTETARTGGVPPDAVRRAAEKLVRGEDLNYDEQFVTEAIIIPDKRPAIDVQDGDYAVTHELWRHFGEDAAIKQRLRDAIASVGRVELPEHPTLPYGGTAFVVGPDLMMTNRHVAEIFSSGIGIRNLRFRPGAKAGVDFLRERERSGSIPVGVREVVMIHPYWDMAILRVDGLGAEQPALRLSLAAIEDLEGEEVAVIGYPAFDPRNDAAVQNQVFGGVYNVKRLQPGKLGAKRAVTSFANRVLAATHDSSTLGGNSGSAVVSAASGHIVALHFGGRYLDANFGVPTGELAIDGRVVDTGVSFVGTPTPRADAYASAWGAEAAAGGAAADAGAAGSLTFTVPLTISIAVGRPG